MSKILKDEGYTDDDVLTCMVENEQLRIKNSSRYPTVQYIPPQLTFGNNIKTKTWMHVYIQESKEPGYKDSEYIICGLCGFPQFIVRKNHVHGI